MPAEEAMDTFRLLFERSADAIFLFDPAEGRIEDANDAAVRLLAAGNKRRLLEMRATDWSPPCQPCGTPSTELAARLSSSAERDGALQFEWTAMRGTGDCVPLEVVATPIRRDGRSLHVLVARDISERRQAEEQLRESRAVLASIADNITEAIYRADAGHRLIFVNRAYLELFRYPSLEALQAVPRERLYADPTVRPRLLELLRRDGQFSQQEVEYVRYDGTRFWGQASARIIHDPDTGQVAFHVGAIADITERRRAADEIQRLNENLERRIAQRTAALAESEARLRTLLDHAPEAIVVCDGETTRFIYSNENASRLFGLTAEQLRACTPLDVSPPVQPDGTPSPQAVAEKIGQAMAGGTPVFDWMHRHSSGRLVPCEIRIVRLPGTGRPLLRGSVIDRTDQRRREKIQQATYQISEAVHACGDLPGLYLRIHQIVGSLMPAGNFYLALLDDDGRISFPYYHDEFGSTPPAPRPLDTGLTGAVIRSGETLMIDARMNALKVQDGNRVTYRGHEHLAYVESGRPAAIWLGVPLKVQSRILGAMAVQDYRDPNAYGEEEKQILGFVAVQTALAIDRKRAQQAVRESEEKFRALFEASSQGVMLHDTERYLEVNPATLRIMGYARAEDLLGRHPADTSPPFQPDGRPSAEASRSYIAECMTTGKARFDWVSRSASGTDLPLEVILTRIEMGGRLLIQAVINDISERKRAEAELRRALEREKELGILKSNFVSMVSHEFRTPLGIIMSSAGILADYFDRLEAAERREHLDSIRGGIRRMADLMEEVLLLARLDSNGGECRSVEFDLLRFCQTLVDEVLSATARRCPIQLRLEGLRETACGDEKLLRHLFSNLLGNAVKYSEPGSPIDFEVSPAALAPGESAGTGTPPRREVQFRVRDRGIGILPEDLPWIFQAFHRGRNVGRRSGTGLGLVIVQRCVELHGGRIDLQSRPGEGTTITVWIPLIPDDAPPALTPPPG